MTGNWFRPTISDTVEAVTDGTECRSRQRCTPVAGKLCLLALLAFYRCRPRPSVRDLVRETGGGDPGRRELCAASRDMLSTRSRPPPVRCAARAAVPYAVPGPDLHSHPQIKNRGDRVGRAVGRCPANWRQSRLDANQSYKRRPTGQARWNLKIARRRSAGRPLCADAPRS